MAIDILESGGSYVGVCSTEVQKTWLHKQIRDGLMQKCTSPDSNLYSHIIRPQVPTPSVDRGRGRGSGTGSGTAPGGRGRGTTGRRGGQPGTGGEGGAGEGGGSQGGASGNGDGGNGAGGTGSGGAGGSGGGPLDLATLLAAAKTKLKKSGVEAVTEGGADDE